MPEHELLIQQFYQAFQQRDYRGMAACYHPAVHFSDPVFLDLHARAAPAMWHMLCERGKDLRIAFQDVAGDESSGSARWIADYTFSATGRPVHNIIDARFTFANGLIIRHQDRFNLWKWAGMALGSSGWLLGWSGLVQNKIRTQASDGLDKFIATHPEYLSTESDSRK